MSRTKGPAVGRVRERRCARRRRSGLHGEGSGWSAARGAAARGLVRGWCEARRGRAGHGEAVVSRQQGVARRAGAAENSRPALTSSVYGPKI